VISVKIGTVIAAAFVAGAFVASPELRAYAANTVFSTDIVDGEVKTADLANNAITSSKIKDSEVKAAEIAQDAVGASELKGVSKLIFAECTNPGFLINTQNAATINCTVAGAAFGDNVLVMSRSGPPACIIPMNAIGDEGLVRVSVWNACTFNYNTGGLNYSLVIYRK
jgi:hypothetical protein